jgi:hypothetical protein
MIIFPDIYLLSLLEIRTIGVQKTWAVSLMVVSTSTSEYVCYNRLAVLTSIRK